MASENTDGATLKTPAAASFPVEARVILKGLVKAPHLNGKRGVVRSGLTDAGRHNVFIQDLDKSVGLKPSNLEYEPISLDDLSVKELKLILKYKCLQPKNLAGMDKSDLRVEVSSSLGESESLPKLLANAKANKDAFIPTTTTHSQAADQLSKMSPDQLRQQAKMMRTMDPDVVRRMNPQLANASDEQLRMAADRMEMMANNPEMIKMAAAQMRGMGPNPNAAATTSNSSRSAAEIPTAFPTPTASQTKQAADMMKNMTPEQFRQQAQMLKTMDPDVIRRTNPQLAHMSDAQIKMAATQFEMMANNPAMMKMAMDQMKNTSPEQLEAMRKGQMPATATTPGGVPSQANMAQMGADPSEMLAGMDKKQLKEMLNTVKDNPEMMKQFADMTGMSEDQLRQGVESFAGMDDSKLEAALTMMKTAQKAKDAWAQADAKVGGKLKHILIASAVAFLGWIVWYFFLRTAAVDAPRVFADLHQQHATEDIIDDDPNSEF
ncbi:unnamed protein product [Pseudo-nitzschia multistriata]|uniref:STI1 domain-containing protein n=1 Tax=Pseudo-nitzschia multistriata TaxID=183589 RepID=A0A448YX02_9STRA|nr:unnamed protein product [Pseudo-nitzschia multistriata]